MRIFWLIFLVVVGQLFSAESPDSRVKKQVFGSDEVMALVRDAEKTEVCLLRYTSPRGVMSRDDPRHETDYVPVDIEVSRRLRTALLNPDTYQWDSLKGCMPRFGLRMRLTKGVSVVMIDFCMRCKILVVMKGDKTLGSGSFDQGAGIFVVEFAKIFPKQEIR